MNAPYPIAISDDSHGFPGRKAGAGVYQRIISLIPWHTRYFEPFLGSGHIMKMKRPAKESFGVDRAKRPVPIAGCDVVQGCGIEFLETHPFREGDFIYCDPPYLFSERGGRFIYDYELSREDHVRLLNALRALRVPVLLSGYPSALYDGLLIGWNRREFTVTTRGGPRRECLWFNYREPEVPFDTRYLGKDFRERERLKRKAGRWVEGLDRLPEHERAVILNGIFQRFAAVIVMDGDNLRYPSSKTTILQGGLDPVM